MDDVSSLTGRSTDVQVRRLATADHPAAHALRVAAFSAAGTAEYPSDGEPDYIPSDRRLGAYDAERLVGHTGVWPFGQWLGGRRLPMAGIASVTVVADQRRRGIAGQLMASALAMAQGAGEVIACLYPTVPALYRRWGFEFAGVRISHRIPTVALTGLPRPVDPPRVRPMDFPDDVAGVARVWDARAVTGHGRIDRGETRHRHAFEPDDGVLCWLAEREGQIVGVLQLARSAPPHGDESVFTQRVTALAGADRDTWLALWHVVAGHASVCATTGILSRPHEPLLDELSLPGHHLESKIEPWMARLLDVTAAVEGRGWPTGAQASLSLHVRDPLFADNDGTFRLEVSEGEGRLTRVERETPSAPVLELDIGAFSALFTGHVTARSFAFQGRLRDGTEADLAALDSVFTSPQPWMHDYF